MWELVTKGLGETLYMVGWSVLLAHAVGIPLGIILTITSKGHIKEHILFNKILGAIINAARSLPFIILLVLIVPFTRYVVGSSIGKEGATVPLIVGAIPFIARIVESSLKEVPWGVVESALAMGASPWQIITKVLLPEAKPSLVLGATITTITLVGYSAMAGVVGGGGLGDIAVRYGFYRRQNDVLAVTVIILIVLVQLIQSIGDFIAAKIDKR